MTIFAKMCNVHRLDVLTDKLKKFVCNYDADRRTKVRSVGGDLFKTVMEQKPHTNTRKT
jgi:hypothetical protein